MIFTALTAYDVQRIQAGDLAAQTGSLEKAAVIGALHLYLDFINLFLFMLRLIGGRNYGGRPGDAGLHTRRAARLQQPRRFDSPAPAARTGSPGRGRSRAR